MGFLEGLTLVFIILHFLGKINWSWWWILSPIWLGYGLGFIFVAIVGTITEKLQRRIK